MSTNIIGKSHNTLSTQNSRLFVVDSRQKETLPDFIRRVRSEKDLSTADVEKQSGYTVTDGYVSHIENGRVKMYRLRSSERWPKGSASLRRSSLQWHVGSLAALD